jgi:RNA polymerase sigma factor (sigma-70 family)
MASAQLGSVLRHLLTAGPSSTASDRELLERFCTGRDEPAFAQLLRRHGPMVLQVGRRVLQHEPDAEDVLQATFLLLARKASSIRKRESVGSWLHGVAYRLALQARHREARRGAHEREAAKMRKSATTAEAAWQELRETLDRALHELPEHHRAVLLLCYLEGQTQEEAARRLGCPLGTVRSRLARARTALQRRLARHGLALSAGGMAKVLAADSAAGAVPAGLLKSTKEAALRFATGNGATGLVSAGAVSLAEGGLKTLFASKTRAVTALALAVGLLVGGVGAMARTAALDPPPAADQAEKPRQAAPRAADPADPLPDGALARLGNLRFRHGSEVLAVSFSPDGKQIVSGDLDGLCLWEVATGKKLFQAQRKDGGASIVAFSPDGKMVAAAGQDQVVVWDATTWKAKRYELKAPGESFPSVAFSADSKALAAGTSKGTVYLWNLTTGKETGRLEGHQGIVPCVAFSPDGKVLASGCYDKTARLWDVAAAKELHVLKGHGGPVSSVAFDRDGKTVATGACGPNEPLRVWDVGTGKEGHRKCLTRWPEERRARGSPRRPKRSTGWRSARTYGPEAPAGELTPIHEFTGVQQHQAERRQRPLASVGRRLTRLLRVGLDLPLLPGQELRGQPLLVVRRETAQRQLERQPNLGGGISAGLAPQTDGEMGSLLVHESAVEKCQRLRRGRRGHALLATGGVVRCVEQLQLRQGERALGEDVDTAASGLPGVGLSPAVAGPRLAFQHGAGQRRINAGTVHLPVELAADRQHGIAHRLGFQAPLPPTAKKTVIDHRPSANGRSLIGAR